MPVFDITVRQANDFVESAFCQEYTAQELKTMEFIISQTVKSDIELAKQGKIKEIELSAHDFAKMINANVYQIYRDANDLAQALTSKKLNLKYIGKNGKPAFEVHVFLTSMKYEDGSIKIGVNPYVLPYFLEIKNHFTEFNLRYMIAMGSSYGIKLYKLLRQYLSIGKRNLSLVELREQFGINANKYKLYADFRKNVIDTAIKHINKHTDIQVNYAAEKLSRKVNNIIFYIKSKLTQEKQAKISFEFWVENVCKDEGLKHQVLDAKKAKKNIYNYTYVKESFELWLKKNVYDFDATSCDPLKQFESGTLFHQE